MKTRGFTLIELLMVISIIALLAAIILAALAGARSGATNAQKIENVRQMVDALEIYYDSTGSYPIPSTGAVNTGCSSADGGCIACLQLNSSGTCLYGGVVDSSTNTALNPYIKTPLSKADDVIVGSGRGAVNNGGISYMCLFASSGNKCTIYALQYAPNSTNGSCGSGKISSLNTCLYTSDGTYSAGGIGYNEWNTWVNFTGW